MNPVRIAILVVAAIAAVMVALLLRNVSAKGKSPPPVATQQLRMTTRVLVAGHDLPVGTRLTDQDMSWQPWPADTVNAAYITDGVQSAPKPVGAAGTAKDVQVVAKDVISGGGPAMRALVGSVVRSDLSKGEPIVAGKLVRAGDGGFLSVVLKPGMRAMAVPVNAEAGVGGFIQPGDRVDVMQSYADTGHHGGAAYVNEMVVSNVRVLAVDQSTDPPKNGRSTVAATLTLEVPAEAAPLVTEAKTRGNIMLALRSYADMAGAPGHPPVAGAGVIRLIRGGQMNQVAVSR